MSSARAGTTLIERLRATGLRPTWARLAIGALLFDKGERHVFAAELFAEAAAAGAPMSLATVYNVLNDFKAAGLVREIAMPGARSCFDTNTANHSHFLDAAKGELLDIGNEGLSVRGIPEAPEGLSVSHVDVVVHLAPVRARNT